MKGTNLKSKANARANEVGAILILDKQGKYRPITIEELSLILNSSPTGNTATITSVASADIWMASDGWANGSPFANGWSRNNVAINGEVLTLSLTNSPSAGKPLTGGEYRTIQSYSYGYYETKMKPLKAVGTMTGYFLYAQNEQYQRICEIDIEFAGNNTNQLRCTYWLGQEHYEHFFDLGFDASARFHTYAIDWQEKSINWYVDGSLVYSDVGARSNGILPSTASQVMMNVWAGDETANSWLGVLDETTLPLTAQFSDFKLYPY